jgi:hypothetical protein
VASFGLIYVSITTKYKYIKTKKREQTKHQFETIAIYKSISSHLSVSPFLSTHIVEHPFGIVNERDEHCRIAAQIRREVLQLGSQYIGHIGLMYENVEDLLRPGLSYDRTSRLGDTEELLLEQHTGVGSRESATVPKRREVSY